MNKERRIFSGLIFTEQSVSLVLFSVTLFISAFLLFIVQPMFGKMVLPMLGGTPSVWNTCMVFFQVILLAGYAYAHITTSWLGVRRQVALHLLLLCIPLFILPITIPSGWRPPTESNPVGWLLSVLLLAVGLPFFVVSTTSPLLQKWLAETKHPDAKDPYFLYAASNLGSFLALLGYPILVEPHLHLASQGHLWAMGYCLFVILTVGCGVFLLRRSVPEHKQAQQTPTATVHAPYISWGRRMWWIILAFVPSSLMLGVTTYLSTDIAAIPLLWVIPLALYLLTFILVFSKHKLIPHALMVRALPIVILPLAILLVAHKTTPTGILIPLHLLMFFVAAMVCHGELAKDRPPTRHLTEFYFWIAVGGAAGGLFNAIIAPMIFDTVIEYPIAMVLACVLRPGKSISTTRQLDRWLDYLIPLALGFMVAAFAMALRISGIESSTLRLTILCVPAALLCYSFRNRSIRFGLGIGAFMLVGMSFTAGWEYVVHVERSFFGVYRVKNYGDGYQELLHGTTLHGQQSLDPNRRREPLTYYYPTGPIGHIFEAFASAEHPINIAAIGLGTASIACYAKPGQQWTFYEIDPVVYRIATNPRYFTFLKECLPDYKLVLGDARLSLASAPPGDYDVMVIDAFSSDAIPIHLLTRQALALYLDKLAPGGIIAFHISNRYLDLEPIIGNLAAQAKLISAARIDEPTKEEYRLGKTASHWVIVARKFSDLLPLKRTRPNESREWYRLSAQKDVPIWTDDFSNILSVFRWQLE